jgi:hypothetical protein
MSTWDDKPNDYEHALAVIERMREAIEYVMTKFEQDEAQGYHTKDREFAITILRKAL